jgi:hypothetical protein
LSRIDADKATTHLHKANPVHEIRDKCIATGYV